MYKRNVNLLAASLVALTLSACGGGGGGTGARPVTAPPPPPAPPPPAPPPTGSLGPTSVVIFPNPKPETYATVGTAAGFSTADADQPHIRYTSGGFYEIQMPGAAYDTLIFYKGAIPQDPATFNLFQPASVPQNAAFLNISLVRLSGYSYSEIAGWGSQGSGGTIAFGSPTPASGVPTTGSATYNGVVQGGSDILQDDFLAGGKVPVNVKGTVALSFDFGAGKLGGSMHLQTDPYGQPVDLGTFSFKDTVYSKGSATYSGAFNTTAPGHNYFLGRFTGPIAQETIGTWALPFTYSADGQTHQASGAWVAKSH